MTETQCIAPEKLRSYVLGELPEPESVQVSSHLEACPDCEATVSALDRESDTLIESLRTPVVQPEPVSVYRLAAKRVAALPPDPSQVADPSTPLQTLRDYELIEPLARGGMATVYRARHVRLNRQVAIKVLPARWLKDPTVVARFEREMQAVGSLRHPAIVQATDGGEADDVHFLVMELVDGVDGSRLVQGCGPLPIADACEIVRQAASGMAYVHASGIIHRDLKPSNLMITVAGEVKILDLGLARITGEQLADDELTTVGQLMGTLQYMAPEQLENSHQVDERTDIFSLGATLYKLLTGTTPHTTPPREPLVSTLRRIASEPTTPIANRRSDLPTALCELVDRMLSQRAEDRPTTMQSIAESLATWTKDADLAERVSRASRVHQQRTGGDESSRHVSPSALLTSPTRSPVVRVSPWRGRWAAIVATGLIGMALVFGAVITLQLRSGQLVIETSTPDVEVRILKAGQPHRQLTLNHTANSLRLAAGEYDIEITSDADGLQIENGRFTLKRGETWLAKIVHKEGDPVAAAPRTEGPTYDGRTLDQWIALLLQDRSPKQFHEATRALDKLATGPREGEAITALLTAMRFHKWHADFQDEGGKEQSISTVVNDFWNGRDPKLLINAISNELDRGNENSIDFILKNLVPTSGHLRPHLDEKLQNHLIKLAGNETPQRRIDALNAVYFLTGPDVVAKQLVLALNDTDPSVQLLAIRKLIGMKSNIDEVVSTLRELVQDGELKHRAEAALRLSELASAAAPALPELISIVKEDDESEVSRALAYAYNDSPTGYGGAFSVKDAAIQAIGEIGDVSTVPVLTNLWIARTTATPKGDTGRLAIVIEQLTGRQPVWDRDAEQVRWIVDSTGFSSAYSQAFLQNAASSKDIVDIARRLLPVASDLEREAAIRSIASPSRNNPSPRQLRMQIEMIELLAQPGDAYQVLNALFIRLYKFEVSDRRSGSLDEASVAYLKTAFQIWDTLEPSLKSESLVMAMALIGKSPITASGMPINKIREWLSEREHRNLLNQSLAVADAPTWYQAVFGLAEIDADDDETFELLTARFVKDPFPITDEGRLNPMRLLNSFVSTLQWQPDLSQRLIRLLEDPRLDIVFNTSVDKEGKQRESSLRNMSLVPLQTVPQDLRERFVPMLERIVESGRAIEANSAKALLNSWQH
jgi:serine/threonine protein kinase